MKLSPSEDTLIKARLWCARQFAKRYDRASHASFLAAEILEEADARFALNSHGVEGWSSETGASGCDYLNMGDSYAATLYVKTQRYSARFSVGCSAGAAGGGM